MFHSSMYTHACTHTDTWWDFCIFVEPQRFVSALTLSRFRPKVCGFSFPFPIWGKSCLFYGRLFLNMRLPLINQWPMCFFLVPKILFPVLINNCLRKIRARSFASSRPDNFLGIHVFDPITFLRNIYLN